jgi:mono/diheme cytochrome c family protein
MALEENMGQEWRQYQNRYHKLRVSSDTTRQNYSLNFSQDIRQIQIDELRILDRCITCHTAIEDSLLSLPTQPYKNHSGNYLKNHPIEKFGCTSCHRGTGRILEVQQGCLPELESSIYALDYTQSACGKCHIGIFNKSKSIMGAEKLFDGLHIFKSQGCLGCHKIRNVGGILGPDLTRQGEKIRGAYNFKHVSGEPTIPNWLKEHFLDPEKISPGSNMVSFQLPDSALDALITLTLGLYPPNYPVNYIDFNMIEDFKSRQPIIRGENLFSLFCGACHGAEGEGKNYEKYKSGVPTLNNRDFLAIASFEFIEFTIWEGRSFRIMSAWNPRISGTYEDELKTIAEYIREWREEGPSFKAVQEKVGKTQEGAELYDKNCSFCHGNSGSGGIAPSLNNQDFLAVASNEYLYRTLKNGRSNTAMPGWSRFSAQEMANLIKFLRGWQIKPSRIKKSNIIPGDPVTGARLFDHLCIRCHGKGGFGGIGPAILNSDFLAVASDEFLYKTIAGGRSHTSMFGWAEDLGKTEKIPTRDLEHLITFMRSIQDSVPEIIYPGESLGNPSRGQTLFEKYCAECHGYNGEGKKAPALNNQEFLNAGTNGYILATISLGRENTAMPSWGKGSEKYKALSGQERWDIVSYIRSWQTVVIPKPWTSN